MNAGADDVSIRRRVFGDGHTIVLRLAANASLKLVGVMIATRVLGPAGYGAYVAAYGVYMFVFSVGLSGIAVYLTRLDGEVDRRCVGSATTALAAESTAIALMVEAVAGPLGDYAKIPELTGVLRIMIIALPLQALAAPALALVERRLDLKGVAVIELSTLAAYYACATPLALAGVGPASLAYALVVQSLLAGPIAYATAGTRPSFAWDASSAAAMMRFAVGFSAANLVLQLRALVNPFVAGPALGAAGVGVIGLTIGILELLTLARTMLWRIAVAALARCRNETGKMRRLIGEGMEIHLLTIGAILLGFAWVGEPIATPLFGARWASIFCVYPFIALSYLTMSAFNLHTAALTVLDHNWRLAAFQGLNALVFAVAAWFAVRAFGVAGYGYAEVAALPTYWTLHRFLNRCGIAPDYRPAAIWWLAAAIGLMWRTLGAWAIAAPFATLLLPPSAARIRTLIADLRGARR